MGLTLIHCGRHADLAPGTPPLASPIGKTIGDPSVSVLPLLLRLHTYMLPCPAPPFIGDLC